MGYKYIINYANYSNQTLSSTGDLLVSFTAGGIAFDGFKLLAKPADSSQVPPIKSEINNIYFTNNVNNATWTTSGWTWKDSHAVIEDLSIIEFDSDPTMHNQLDQLINENTLVAIPDTTYSYTLKDENLILNNSGGAIDFISADYDNPNISRLYRAFRVNDESSMILPFEGIQYRRETITSPIMKVYDPIVESGIWLYDNMNKIIFLSDPSDVTDPLFPDSLVEFLETNKVVHDYPMTANNKILKTSSGKVLVIKK